MQGTGRQQKVLQRMTYSFHRRCSGKQPAQLDQSVQSPIGLSSLSPFLLTTLDASRSRGSTYCSFNALLATTLPMVCYSELTIKNLSLGVQEKRMEY
jgi:hypothetical protein